MDDYKGDMKAEASSDLRDDVSTLPLNLNRGGGQTDRRRRLRWSMLQSLKLILPIAFIILLITRSHPWSELLRPPGCGKSQGRTPATAKLCAQPEALRPSDEEFLRLLYGDFDNEVFVNKSAELLGAAVRIETESYDDLGLVGEDKTWDKFGPFHEWLEGAFPHTHAKVKKETVNTWGLVYTWQGSDESLKPLLLAAHQDTVPVDRRTVDDWVQPPFSGLFDGKWIFGRGSCDDKSQLVGIMIALETLARHDFKPTRTIVLASGFDEEIGGLQGARHIGEFLLERYGPDGISMILDEGIGYSEQMGQLFAVPGIGERGHVNVRILVNTAGGHSSVPPPHTGIGILSALVQTVEGHPIPPSLTRLNPYYTAMQCLAEHAPSLPKRVRRTIKKAQVSDNALKKVAEWAVGLPSGVLFPFGGSLVTTTQAVTLIQGGVKANALPEQSYAVINHRISVDASVAEVHSHLTDLLGPKIDQFNLSLTAFGNNAIPSKGRVGSVILSDIFGQGLDPAPVTATDGPVWPVFSGTIKAVFAQTQKLQKLRAHRGEQLKEAKEIIIAPGIPNFNTDTRHYWALSKNIFRYAHLNPDGMYNGLHTINEGITIENFLGHVQFITFLVLNVNEADF